MRICCPLQIKCSSISTEFNVRQTPTLPIPTAIIGSLLKTCIQLSLNSSFSLNSIRSLTFSIAEFPIHVSQLLCQPGSPTITKQWPTIHTGGYSCVLFPPIWVRPHFIWWLQLFWFSADSENIFEALKCHLNTHCSCSGSVKSLINITFTEHYYNYVY